MTVADARGTDVWSWDLRARQLVRWTESELGGIDPALLADAEVVRFRSFDGRMIPAIVERPRTRAPGRAPVIINIHGGPRRRSARASAPESRPTCSNSGRW
jgi:dipeptidyl aminopeptidase/acylaminoacyl peptidase